MKTAIPMILLAHLAACSGSNFSSASAESQKANKKKPAPEVVDDSSEDDADERSTATPTPTPSPSPSKTVEVQDDVVINPCLLSARGDVRTTATIDGENCINNGVDPGGADFDDYHVTITGDLLKDGWQLFAQKEQEIEIRYDLGTPGSTTQVVSMQVVDCNGKEAGKFDVSSGSGTTKLKARKGDRFTLVTSITSGCYGRRDIYDLLKDQEKAFRMR